MRYKIPKPFDFGIWISSLTKPHSGEQIIPSDELVIHRRTEMQEDQQQQYRRYQAVPHAWKVLEKILGIRDSPIEHSREVCLLKKP